MNITSAVRTVKSVITANSPVLLLGTTIAGVVTTGVLAAKAGYKARGIVDEAEGRYKDFADRELDTQEKVRLTWLCFAVPAVTGASTIAAAVGTHTIHTKRANAMAALYAVTSNKLDDMTEKAEELLGPKKTQQLRDGVAQKAVDREGEFDNQEVILTDTPTELCHDDLSGRWFMGSITRIEEAVNDLNRRLVDDGEAALNDFYDSLGLPANSMGTMFGWQGPKKVRVGIGSVNTSDGRSAISVYFQDAPSLFGNCP